jgi:hypothetical protein
MSINYTATISINYTIPLLNLCPIIFGLIPVAGLFALFQNTARGLKQGLSIL